MRFDDEAAVIVDDGLLDDTTKEDSEDGIEADGL